MEKWEQRAKKLDARRRRMRVTGRGLLTTEPPAIQKRHGRMAKAGKRRKKA
ncbi:MAG TPA: hypothetical protein PKD27_07845 [Tepidiformaceae bacterium]|nr:hypothetical protein [Tepidiformaceae bacterium]